MHPALSLNDSLSIESIIINALNVEQQQLQQRQQQAQRSGQVAQQQQQQQQQQTSAPSEQQRFHNNNPSNGQLQTPMNPTTSIYPTSNLYNQSGDNNHYSQPPQSFQELQQHNVAHKQYNYYPSSNGGQPSSNLIGKGYEDPRDGAMSKELQALDLLLMESSNGKRSNDHQSFLPTTPNTGQYHPLVGHQQQHQPQSRSNSIGHDSSSFGQLSFEWDVSLNANNNSNNLSPIPLQKHPKLKRALQPPPMIGNNSTNNSIMKVNSANYNNNNLDSKSSNNSFSNFFSNEGLLPSKTSSTSSLQFDPISYLSLNHISDNTNLMNNNRNNDNFGHSSSSSQQQYSNMTTLSSSNSKSLQSKERSTKRKVSNNRTEQITGIGTQKIPSLVNANGNPLERPSSMQMKSITNSSISNPAESLLHNSCKLFAKSLSIIESALQFDPDAIRTAIPTLCSNQSTSSPTALPNVIQPVNANSTLSAIRNYYSFPINIALQYDASTPVLELLVQSCPDALSKSDGPNQTSTLSIALSSIKEEPLPVSLDSNTIVTSGTAIDDLSTNNNYNNNNDDDVLIQNVVDAVVRTTNRLHDSNNNAASSTCTTNHNTPHNHDQSSLSRIDQLIRLFITANPACVRVVDRRSNTALHYMARRRGDISCETITMVYALFPEALHMRNCLGQTPVQTAQRNSTLSDDLLNHWCILSYREQEQRLEQSLLKIDEEIDESSEHSKTNYGDGCGSGGVGGGGGQGSVRGGSGGVMCGIGGCSGGGGKGNTTTALKACDATSYLIPSVLPSSKKKKT